MSISVTNFSGRGSRTVTQQPTSSNSYRTIILIQDGDYSEGSYSFNISMTYNTGIEIYTSDYNISLNDLWS